MTSAISSAPTSSIPGPGMRSPDLLDVESLIAALAVVGLPRVADGRLAARPGDRDVPPRFEAGTAFLRVRRHRDDRDAVSGPGLGERLAELVRRVRLDRKRTHRRRVRPEVDGHVRPRQPIARTV